MAVTFCCVLPSVYCPCDEPKGKRPTDSLIQPSFPSPMRELQVSGISKRYGSTIAVNDVSFSARPGRILGLLGPNGAGKTSTIRMITYITVPDQGTVTYGGETVGAWSQQQMGYLPEERGLYKQLRVKEQLVYLGMLKGMSKAESAERSHYWLDRFEATSWASKKTEEDSRMPRSTRSATVLMYRVSSATIRSGSAGPRRSGG